MVKLFSISTKDLPAVASWKKGETYEITVYAVMVSDVQKSDMTGTKSADFAITKMESSAEDKGGAEDDAASEGKDNKLKSALKGED